MGKLNGLDLFSGIGGLTLSLSPWVEPVAYCENDRYAQAVLLSRMSEGQLPKAGIWDDVSTLLGDWFTGSCDIIYGGFPCQDISVAGNGKGLAGERSGLVFEVFRLISEVNPAFIFLENVPAIRTRGGERVVKELAALGYDCRWSTLSAFDVGAPHKRDRWFLLAYRDGDRCESKPKFDSEKSQSTRTFRDDTDGLCHPMADNSSIGRRKGRSESEGESGRFDPLVGSWWDVEPDVGRVAHGVPARVDRIRGLGNAVVSQCAREAFKKLMGLAA